MKNLTTHFMKFYADIYIQNNSPFKMDFSVIHFPLVCLFFL